MKIIKIKAKKQENGLWGTPLNLYRMDSVIHNSEKNDLIHSAICVAVNETHEKKFEILLSDENGFILNISNCGHFSIKYSRYEVVDDCLYEFNDEQEHNTFLRKNKLKKINYEY